MYYELFDSVFNDNENKICIFEIGAFYVILNEQAVYISSVLGLKKICFAPGICKVGFPLNSLSKYVKKLKWIRRNFRNKKLTVDGAKKYIAGHLGYIAHANINGITKKYLE